MKQISLIVFAVAIILQGCIKVPTLGNINFNVPYSQQVSVPQVAGDTFGVALPQGGAVLSIPSIPFATNSQQYITNYNTSASKILNVDLSSLSLQMLSPSSQNFDFLDSVDVYISAPSQPEVLAAYQSSVAKGQTTLTLNTETDVNLKNYFIQDTIYFRISAHINSVPATGTQLNVSSVFQVQANLLN